MILLDITTYLGHLHPLIVHLPIGFLLLAVLFELLSYVKRYEYLKPAVSFALLLGFISAVFACIFGYMLSLSGDYDLLNLANHKITGIAVAVVSGLLFLCTTTAFRNKISISRWLFSSFFIGLFFLMTYTGHQGGNLTHGSDYLSLKTLRQRELKKPSSVDEALLFEDVVQPLLAKRCSQCHNEGKMKGELSVQTLQGLLKGGKSRPAVVGGKLHESELYERITLDPSNKKYMPADGKTPLTKEETAIIKWWIEKGMAMSGVKIADLKNGDEIKPRVAVFLGLGDGGEIADNSGIAVNPDIPKSFNQNLLDSLRNKGVHVRLMSHNPVMLDITMPAGSGDKLGIIKSNLRAVAKNVIWLNLSNNKLTENDLDFLPLMTNLEKLRLEKNPVADGISSQIVGLQHLEAVNLNETKITRACTEKLKQMPNLKRVYTWKTLAE
ncbi:c-type cytochrome domain-containing protein [Flavihumibacter profundi]|uniref:c-type cytochrome domain-containing protein n=1 Tax=Flavihumibacter profundi TaxID=2716883 RepID=UPI001CC60FED|nr:c-type cytochrome domain-containing protein [Flavihumibacter profundi]MBZ5858778.1 hypothetical protein [Flavihumibacter profundi]